MKTFDLKAFAAMDEAERAVVGLNSCAIEATPITKRVVARWLNGGEMRYGKHTAADKQQDWTFCHPRHLPEPQLCYGLGHMPGHLMCADWFLLEAAKSRDACDWCNGEPGDPAAIHATVRPLGPALVLFAFCDNHIAEPRYDEGPNWIERLRHILRTQSFLPALRSRATDTE